MSNAAGATQDDSAPLAVFLHIADIHFWRIVWQPWRLLNKRLAGNLNVLLRRRHRYPMALAAAHGNRIADLGVGYAVLTGDFTSTALPAEFEQAGAFVDALVHAGVAPAILPGNHDVYTLGAFRTDRCRNYLGAYMPERYPARWTLPGGVPLVLVPTVRPGFWHSRGHISRADIEETAELVRTAPAGPVVVAAHYPILEKSAAYESPWQRRLARAAELRQALGQTGRHMVYCAGHVHRFSFVQDADFPHMVHLTTGALIEKRTAEGTHGEFCAVRVYADHFEVVRHLCRGEWTAGAVELSAPCVHP